MTTDSRSQRIPRWVLRLAAAIVIPALVFVAWDQANHNFGEVAAGTSLSVGPDAGIGPRSNHPRARRSRPS